jgi:hypothetical protein
MNRILIALAHIILLSAAGLSKAQNSVTTREAAVSGSFYPASQPALLKMLEEFFNKAPEPSELTPLALVVPHAGYVFSGEVAAAGFKQIPRNQSYKHIFIIGPSHRMYFNGVSIYTQGGFQTPLGIVPIDPLASELSKKSNVINSDPAPHRLEHCLEVQLPFLQYWLQKPFSIIPILVGGESRETCRQLASVLEPYFSPENLFIISSDFSHYPNYSIAQSVDKKLKEAIKLNNPDRFMTIKNEIETQGYSNIATAMCGFMPMLTLLQITQNHKDIRFQEILYKNSGDSPSGDKNRVVGYWALAVVKNSGEKQAFELSDSDKLALLTLARNSIEEYLKTNKLPKLDEKNLSPNLLTPAGAFVTLKQKGELRGCIGSFNPEKPLYQVVQSMAIAAATQDSRFIPVTPNEMKSIEIEISVLTPLQKIRSLDEFELGRDGIYMRKGNRSGTFLPQVATETRWSLDEFMGHCARDKAGIGWNGWKEADTELYKYQALIFHEHEFLNQQK